MTEKEMKRLSKKLIKDGVREINKPGVRELLYTLKTGHMVRIKEEISWEDIPAGTIGIAEITHTLDESNPIQLHGGIEVTFPNGVKEYYCQFRWWNSLEIVQ